MSLTCQYLVMILAHHLNILLQFDFVLVSKAYSLVGDNALTHLVFALHSNLNRVGAKKYVC